MGDDQNFLAAEKWVRIMCDYTADGVWSRSGGFCSADDLPVSAHILAMIRGWQAWYEYADPSAKIERWFDDKAHAAFGLFIARLVKRDLPDWTVIYHDDSKIPVGWGPGQSREPFEYEIILNADGTFSP